jgi:hypothetical protein
MMTRKPQIESSATEAHSVDARTLGGNVKRREQRTAARHRRFINRMEKLTEELDRLKKMIDSQTDCFADEHP